VGCILGELLSGKPVFPGTSTMNQLDRIMEVTGHPNMEDIEAIKSPFAETMLESLSTNRQRPLCEMFPSASIDALDLMRCCVQLNPTKRTSAKDSLQHLYVVDFFQSPEDELDCDRVIQIPIDDNTKLTVEDYRERLYHEVLKKKKEQGRSHRKHLQRERMAPPQLHTRSHTDLHSHSDLHPHSHSRQHHSHSRSHLHDSSPPPQASAYISDVSTKASGSHEVLQQSAHGQRCSSHASTLRKAPQPHRSRSGEYLVQHQYYQPTIHPGRRNASPMAPYPRKK